MKISTKEGYKDISQKEANELIIAGDMYNYYFGIGGVNRHTIEACFLVARKRLEDFIDTRISDEIIKIKRQAIKS